MTEFQKAFAKAYKAGKKTFTFKGRLYSTKLKKHGSNSTKFSNNTPPTKEELDRYFQNQKKYNFNKKLSITPKEKTDQTRQTASLNRKPEIKKVSVSRSKNSSNNLQSAKQKQSEYALHNKLFPGIRYQGKPLTLDEYQALANDQKALQKQAGTLSQGLSETEKNYQNTLNNYNNNSWFGAYGTGSGVNSPQEESLDNAKRTFETASLGKLTSIPAGLMGGASMASYGILPTFGSYLTSQVGADVAHVAEPDNPYAPIIGSVIGGALGLGPKALNIFSSRPITVSKGGSGYVPKPNENILPGGQFVGSRYTGQLTVKNGAAAGNAMRHGPHFQVGSRYGGSTAPRTVRVTNVPKAQNMPSRGNNPKIGTYTTEEVALPPVWPIPVTPYNPTTSTGMFIPNFWEFGPQRRYVVEEQGLSDFSKWFKKQLETGNINTTQFYNGDERHQAGNYKIVLGGPALEKQNSTREATGQYDYRGENKIAPERTKNVVEIIPEYNGPIKEERIVSNPTGGISPHEPVIDVPLLTPEELRKFHK